MMDDQESFLEVLNSLTELSRSRDPRSVRIASVASALIEVVEGEITPGKVYASTVTTLEGTLHQVQDEANLVLDSLVTQAALLNILGAAVPYVSSSVVTGTIGLTSRVLRGIVSSCLSILVSDDAQGALLDTKDGLGAISTVLCNACATTAEVLRNLSNTTEDSVIRQLLHGTLMRLLQDPRQKVQNSAKDALSGLLLMKSPSCHPSILKTTTKYVNAQIDSYMKRSSKHGKSQNMIEILGFLNSSLISMDFAEIGGRIMHILVKIMNEESSSVSAKSHASTLQVLTVNAILSTMLSLLEADEDVEEDRLGKVNAFAARILATLVQARPTLFFKEGAAELDLLESGRTIYGQVMLSASQRLLIDNETVDVGVKLTPLVFQQLISLSRPVEEDSEAAIAETLFVEASQLIRIQMLQLKDKNYEAHDKCTRDCVRVMTTVMQSPFDEAYAPILKPLALMLQQSDAEEIVSEIAVSFLDLRCDLVVSDRSRGAAQEALAVLVEGIGVEKFWRVVDLSKLLRSVLGDEVPNRYSWVFDVLKASGSVVTGTQTHLEFFQDEILPLARQYDACFVKSTKGGAVFRSQVINIWTMFQLFCYNPSDLETGLPKIAPILIKAMNDQRYPEFVRLICKGLDVLACGVVKRVEEFQELIDGEQAASIRSEAAVLERLSMKILPSLFKIVDTLSCKTPKSEDSAMDVEGSVVTNEAPRIEIVAQTIASIARLAPKSHIQGLFSKLIQRMLENSQSEDEQTVEKMCSLLTLAQALVRSGCLDESSISLLYRSLKPLIRNPALHPKVQKRAYKLLSEICCKYHSFVAQRERLKEVIELLSTTTVTSQVSARSMRLKCLTLVVEGFEGSPPDVCQNVTTPLVGETLLCLKDSNARTRESGYKLLLTMARIHGDLPGFIRVVAAAIGSTTSYMRSAAVTALARLIFEYSSDEAVKNTIPALLKTVLMLSDDPSREVTKSMVVFVRVTVAAASPEQLQPLLPDILSGLLKYHRGKDRFRAKIKIIIKRLVKIFGFDALMPFVPPSDSRLLTHMRKLSEREARRKNSRRYEEAQENPGYDVMVDSEGEEDSDAGLTLVTGMTRVSRMSRVMSQSGKQTLKRGRSDAETYAKSAGKSTKSGRAKASVRIKNDVGGDALDLKELKTVRFAESGSDDSDSDGDVEFDASGKLVVHDIEDGFSTVNHDDDETMFTSKSQRSMTSKVSKLSRAKDERKKNQKLSARPGQSYKSKRAGGDVKRKGQKYEPYAYVQLDGRSYSKKNRRNAVEQMSSVVQRGNKRQKR